jgi:hypothetical protein
VYEKWEEYEMGESSFQSNKMSLEHAVFNNQTKELYFEKLEDTGERLEKWVIEATHPSSIKIKELRIQCKNGVADEGYGLRKVAPVSPNWGQHIDW